MMLDKAIKILIKISSVAEDIYSNIYITKAQRIDYPIIKYRLKSIDMRLIEGVIIIF